MAKGTKYGLPRVEAISGPLDGELVAGQVTATADNQWQRFTAAETPIEGVVIKALAGNSGTVYVTGAGGSSAGFPLAAGDTVSLAVNDLSRVHLFFAASGDGAAYLAIAKAV